MRELLSRVGDKWSMLIIMMLSQQPWRFNALKRSIEGMSQRMLTLTLRNLERDGFVVRTVYASVPPSVEYALTPLGESLCEPVSALGRWVQDNMGQIGTARRRYDAAAKRNA
jgi:DNA-binding HxlR family transcriptional regulator